MNRKQTSKREEGEIKNNKRELFERMVDLYTTTGKNLGNENTWTVLHIASLL